VNPATTPTPHVQAAGDVLAVCLRLARIRDNTALSVEERLHCLRIIRRNLAGYEDRLATQDAAAQEGGGN